MILRSLSSTDSSVSLPVRRALLSVYDKRGLVDFATSLVDLGIELVSTGGTSVVLCDAGLPVRDVSDLTNFPEIMDGRLKTLNPLIHGGLLAVRDLPAHQSSMSEHNILPIDLLVVNFYPFERARLESDNFSTILENIDIGGPAMVRSAAKNHAYTSVLTDPTDYDSFLTELCDNSTISSTTRRRLAAKALGLTAYYDSQISDFLHDSCSIDSPSHFTLGGSLLSSLRYGENPHQRGTLYRSHDGGVANGELIHGIALSYNNYNDSNAAYNLVCEFESPAVAIIKHCTPCGVACGDNLAAAYGLALSCDSDSAFGGIVAVNRVLDSATATAISDIFTEVVLFPDIDTDAFAILSKKTNLRLLRVSPTSGSLDVRSISGGILVQESDTHRLARSDCRVVSRRSPSESEWRDLLFSFTVAKHVRSNAIVYASDCATLGIGAGQMSRVDSARLAFMKKGAGECVAASDAFFPFSDGLQAIIDSGATAVIQPGGSRRDAEVIATADAAGIAMVFTDIRHFRH